MMLRVATRPLQRRMMSSQAVAKVDAGVYAAELGQGYAPTMTYSNRCAHLVATKSLHSQETAAVRFPRLTIMRPVPHHKACLDRRVPHALAGDWNPQGD